MSDHQISVEKLRYAYVPPTIPRFLDVSYEPFQKYYEIEPSRWSEPHIFNPTEVKKSVTS